MSRPLPILLALALAAACGGGAPDDGDDDVTPDATAEVDAPPDAPACGGAELCARTIDECGIQISMASCLAFYDPATTTCRDIANYTTCNCGCIGEDTCDGYFACGTTCFEDWC